MIELSNHVSEPAEYRGTASDVNIFDRGVAQLAQVTLFLTGVGIQNGDERAPLVDVLRRRPRAVLVQVAAVEPDVTRRQGHSKSASHD